MKWIGQHIYDLVSRFRDDFYLEALETSTENDIVVVNSEGKVSKRAASGLTVGTATLASTVEVTNSTVDANQPVVFNNEVGGLRDDTGAFTYNPSTGTLTTPNLTVTGTTTTINTTNLNVEDKNIILNYNDSSDTSGTADGAGITIQDAVDASTDASLTWIAANDAFTFSHPLTVTGYLTTTGDLTSTGATFSNSSANRPLVVLENTTDDATGPSLYLQNIRDGNGLSASDVLGNINFDGEDGSGNFQSYAQIKGTASSVTHTDEAGQIELLVTTSDGTTPNYRNAFKAYGHPTGDKVAIHLGYGAGGDVACAGGLSVVSGATINNPSDGGSTALLIDNDDVDQKALHINAENTTANIIDINAGDLTTGDAIFIDTNSLTTGSALKIDIDDAQTSTNLFHYLNQIDYDKSGVIADGATRNTTGLKIDMTDAATNHANSNVRHTGIDVTLNAASNSGTLEHVGFHSSNIGSGDVFKSFSSTLNDLNLNAFDFYARSSAIAIAGQEDYFFIRTNLNGATTLATVDYSHALAHMTIEADGNVDVNGVDITLDASGSILLEASTTVTGDLSVNGNDITFSSADSAKPSFALKNSSTDAEAPEIIFQKTATGADNDDLGKILFKGDDASDNVETYAQILGEIAEADHGSEEGKLTLSVASHDGELQPGLTIASGVSEDAVEVTLGTVSSNGHVNINGTLGRIRVVDEVGGGTNINYEFGNVDNTSNINIIPYSQAASRTSAQMPNMSITLGNHTPVGTDQAGKHLNLMSGMSTGNAAPGKIYLTAFGQRGSSGTSTNESDGVNHIFGYDEIDLFTNSNNNSEAKLIIHSSDSTAANSGELQFKKDGFNPADTEDGEALGKITFYGEDEGANNTQFAEIITTISESDETNEAGKLEIKVAASDGTTTNLYSGLILEGEHDSNPLQVDATIGYGANSTTSVTGNLNIASTTTTSGPLNVNGTATFNSDTITMQSSNADDPVLKLLNTTSDDEGARLIIQKMRADDGVASGQNVGEIVFRGQDDGQADEDYAQIIAEIDVSTHGQESGKITHSVAAHDGGNHAGLILQGGSESGEVDVTVAKGANSLTTIAGNLTVTNDLTVSGGNATINGGDTADSILKLATNTASASDDVIIELVTDEDGTPRQARIGVDHSDNTLKLVHGSGFSGGTNGICVDSSGNVGLGTASPEAHLHLESAGDTAIIVRADVGNSGENDNPLIHLQQDYTVQGAGGVLVDSKFGIVGNAAQIYQNSLSNAAYITAQGSGSATAIQFATGGLNGQDISVPATLATARMTIAGDGNIGIGVTDPDSLLEIFGTSTQLKLSNNASDYATLATGTHGNLTITTVDGGSTNAHIELAADGNIILDAAGDIALEVGGGDVTGDANNYTFTSVTSSKPQITLFNVTDDTTGPVLRFHSDRAAGEAITADGDILGTISFTGTDSAGGIGGLEETYAYIQAQALETTSLDEAGRLEFYVANNGADTLSLQMSASTATAGEVDVGIASGAASVTTIAGTLTMGSTATLNNSGVLQTAAQTNITSVGTLTGLTTSGAIELGHDTDTTIARSAAGTATIEGNQIMTSGVATGNIIHYACPKYIAIYMFYMNTVNYWYTPPGYNTTFSTSADLDGATLSASYQARMVNYTAPRACKIKKASIVFYQNSLQSGGIDLEWQLVKWTPADDTNSSASMTKMTMTDHNGAFTETDVHRLIFDVTDNAASTLAAGDCIAFCGRVTSGSGTVRNLVNGQLTFEIELT